MADDKAKADPGPAEVDDLAFQIFAQRAAVRTAGEQDAVAAYRQAEAFLAVRRKVRAGELKAKGDPDPRADCSAPNLKRSHPINLVSQRFGDLNRVARIRKFLDANPTPENDPDDLVAKLNREFPDLGWDLATTNTARAIFPAFAAN